MMMMLLRSRPVMISASALPSAFPLFPVGGNGSKSYLDIIVMVTVMMMTRAMAPLDENFNGNIDINLEIAKDMPECR